MHKEITSVIEKRYSADARTSALIHFVMACFYRKQCDPNNDEKWLGKDAKALTELPYHMVTISFFIYLHWHSGRVLA